MSVAEPQPGQSQDQKTLTDLALSAGKMGLWTLDLSENIIYYDEQCQSLFGLTSPMSYEAAFSRILEEDSARVQAKLAAAFDPAGDGVFREEFRLTSGDDVIWVLAQGVTEFSAAEQPEPLRFVGTVQDIRRLKAGEFKQAELAADLELKVRERTQEVRTLAADLTLAEQAERQRLAKTLHDTVQQELYAIQFSLASMRKELEGRRVAQQLEASLDALKATVKLTRRITPDLKPDALDEEDVALSLSWLAETMQSRHGLEVDVKGVEPFTVKNPAMRSLLYNLASELLFNVVKHASVKKAALLLDREGDDLRLSVSDAGAGFTPNFDQDKPSGTGLGLSGVHKRLKLFGGVLKIESEPGKGTTVTVFMPNASLS